MQENEIDLNIAKLLKYDKKELNEVKSVFEFIDAHQLSFLEFFNYGGFIKHFEIGFDGLIEAMQLVNYEQKNTRPTQRGTQWLIIKNNLPSLFSSYNLLISGFYLDSIILIRSIFESIIRIIYLSHYPENEASVLFYKPGKNSFNITNFTKNELKVDWHYKLLSVKSHSNGYKTLTDLIDISKNGQKKIINIELGRDINDLSMCVNRIYFILWNYIYFTKEFLLKDNKEYNSKLADIEKGLLSVLFSLSLSHKNRFYNSCNEAMAIYEKMKTIEMP